MKSEMMSIGVDVGTSTTQVIFSKLKIENTQGFGAIPKIEIVSKEIIYESPVYQTPLKSENEINSEEVVEILKKQYEEAGVKSHQIDTGAVIITGETLKKKNAKSTAQTLSEVSGDFIVVTAGPDLESILAGKGIGADEISLQTNRVTANLDIGGGTTNICIFSEGEVIDTACLNIGGRLIKIADGKITYVSDWLKPMLKEMNISLNCNDVVNEEIIKRITDRMSTLIEEALGFREESALLKEMYTNHGLKKKIVPEQLTFSGGVAECMNGLYQKYQFGDIGIHLADSIKTHLNLWNKRVEKVKSASRATVIGAGNFSMNVSGSTIGYYNCAFPYKNVPVLRVKLNEKEDLENVLKEMKIALERKFEQKKIWNDSKKRFEYPQFAVAFRGIKIPSYSEIEKMADVFQKVFETQKDGQTAICICESDIAKVLSQSLRRRIKNRPILCVDNISCGNEDYIDIGEPIAGGIAVPVVVKTLLFETNKEEPLGR